MSRLRLPRAGSILLMLALLPFIPSSRAEETPSTQPTKAPVRRMSLAEVIERARAASPSLGRLRSLRDAGEASLRGARAERLPRLDLSAGYTRASHVPELALTLPPPGGTRTIFPDLPDNYSSRLALSVPLYTGGRLSNLSASAEQDRLAAERDLDVGTAEIVLEASSTYWSLVTALESERVLREAVGSYEAHLTDALNRERLGLAARNEVLAVQVERDRSELARLQSGSTTEILRADLARLAGLPPGSRVEPSEPLEGSLSPEEDLEKLVAEALATRPDRAALLARIDSADALTRAARADHLPQARFAAGYDTSNPNRRILPLEDRWEDTWDVSVSVFFKLFDSGRTAAAVEERSALSEAARRQLEDLDQGIRFEVTRRLLELRTAGAEAEVAKRNLDAARENLRVASERFRAGVIPSSELLDSEVALQFSGLDRTGALARQRLAVARLDRAVGR